jgi:hypothetical protein
LIRTKQEAKAFGQGAQQGFVDDGLGGYAQLANTALDGAKMAAEFQQLSPAEQAIYAYYASQKLQSAARQTAQLGVSAASAVIRAADFIKDPDVQTALRNGDIKTLSAKVPPEARQRMMKAFYELQFQLLDLSPHDAGRVCGFVAYLIIETAVIEAATAGLGAAAESTRVAQFLKRFLKPELVTKIQEVLRVVAGASKGAETLKAGEKAAEVTQLGGRLIKVIKYVCTGACFAPGTLLLTPNGFKAVEDFQCGDLVLSRPESECEAEPVAKVVEKTFVREAALYELRVQGDALTTTAEHPFYVRGQGWRLAKEIRAGDELSTPRAQWIACDVPTDLARRGQVYNVQVADFHTYFVAASERIEAVWAHNAECEIWRELGKDGVTVAWHFAENGNVLKTAASEGELLEWVAQAGKRIELVVIDGSKHPASATHAQDAIDAGVQPTGVIDRPDAKPRRVGRLKNEQRVPGLDRDEFPPAMLDNGSGGHSVRPIGPGDNRGAGSSLGHQLDGVPNGTSVIVKPINVPPKTP